MVIDKGQYSPQPGAVFELSDFAATLVARGKTQPLCSMRTTEVEHGDVFITPESLSRIFNRKATQAKSNISDIKIEIDKGTLHLKGKMHKKIDIPFDIEGSVSTDGANLILHANKIHAEGLPVKGLLHMVGMHLSSLMQGDKMNGVTATEDTLIFEPEKISHIRGKIASATVANNGLAISFVRDTPKQQAQK